MSKKNFIYPLFFLSFLNSCSSYRIFSLICYQTIKYFYLSSYENVKIVEQDSKITGANIHPVKIKPEQISSALQQFIIRVGNDTFSMFPDNKINFVSDAISEGIIKSKSASKM